jgi:hypothetical protein
MGLRFRDRLRFGRGVWLDLVKRAAGTSMGGHGANVSKRGTHTTLGLPAGLSYQFARQPWMSPHAIGTGPIAGLIVIVGIVLLLAVLSGH